MWRRIGRTLTRPGWALVGMLLLGLLLAVTLLARAELRLHWCEPGEIGDWALGLESTLFLARVPTRATAADLRCQVRPDAKILVLDPGKAL